MDSEKVEWAYDDGFNELMTPDDWDIAEYRGTLKRAETKAEDVLSRIGYAFITGQLGTARRLYNEYIGME
jgi:hypothetical protein